MVIRGASGNKTPSIMIATASAKIFKVEEKLAKGWGGENAYHVKGYRYLLVDGDRNISRASPPGKVTTLTKESLLTLNKVREDVDLERNRTKGDGDVDHEKDLEICIRAKNNAWVIARATRGKELYIVLEKANETLLYASEAVEKFSDRTWRARAQLNGVRLNSNLNGIDARSNNEVEKLPKGLCFNGLDRAGQALGILPALEVVPLVETAPNAEITSATLKSRMMVSIPPNGLGPSTEDPLEIDVDPGARRDGDKTNLHRLADLKAALVTRAIRSQEEDAKCLTSKNYDGTGDPKTIKGLQASAQVDRRAMAYIGAICSIPL
ncbi:vacuolar fusion protein CCZ1 homolog isoform X1 [Tanacetum coccineum]